MTNLAEKLGLRDDQFAIYFSGTSSLEASDLGKFLQRASTVARHRGAILLVDDIKPGSLAVILRAARRGGIGKAIGKEFKDAPVKTTAATGTLTALVAGAIVSAMTMMSGHPSPVAKAGAELVVEHHVERIDIVTREKSVIVMDHKRATKIVREKNWTSTHEVERIETDVENARLEARKGILTGSFVDVDGLLHFRPDGYSFLVPVISVGLDELPPPGHYRINGDLAVRHGAPDQLYVRAAHEL